MRIILASKSPRRRQLMDMLGLDFEVMPSGVDEGKVKLKESDPYRLAQRLARMKAEDVAERLREHEDGQEAVVIGADTLASFRGRVIGKAGDSEEAMRTLRGYQGREHEQVTGLCIINTRTGKVLEACEVTRSVVREVGEKSLEAYVGTGEPMEGAGCYTPRAHVMLFSEIKGSWSNIVGMPMARLVPMLGEAIRG